MEAKKSLHTCSLCSKHKETHCDEEKHKKHGFSLSSFTNFSAEDVFEQADDSIKQYLNAQSIIF